MDDRACVFVDDAAAPSTPARLYRLGGGVQIQSAQISGGLSLLPGCTEVSRKDRKRRAAARTLSPPSRRGQAGCPPVYGAGWLVEAELLLFSLG